MTKLTNEEQIIRSFRNLALGLLGTHIAMRLAQTAVEYIGNPTNRRYKRMLRSLERDIKKKTKIKKIYYGKELSGYDPKKHVIYMEDKFPITLAHEAGHALIQNRYGHLQQLPKKLESAIGKPLIAASFVLPSLAIPAFAANAAIGGGLLAKEYLAWKKGYNQFLKKRGIPKKDVAKDAIPALGTHLVHSVGLAMLPLLAKPIVKHVGQEFRDLPTPVESFSMLRPPILIPKIRLPKIRLPKFRL